MSGKQNLSSVCPPELNAGIRLERITRLRGLLSFNFVGNGKDKKIIAMINSKFDLKPIFYPKTTIFL
jgi:hypothetical protein